MLVDYVTKGNRPIVHTWDRDEDGNRVHETHDDFRPYFYIHANETADPHRFEQVDDVISGDWRDIHDEPLQRVVCRTPDDVGGYNGIRGKFEKTWESDVFFRTRYWLDELKPDDVVGDYRILSFDIEVDYSLDVANAPERVLSISAHDSFKDKYITFLLEPPNADIEAYKNENESLYVYDTDDERGMLLDFIDFVKSIDPDIVTAWNLDGYDAPYIINRMRNLRIDYSELSPINRVEVSNDGERVHTVRGREFIDLIDAFKKVYFQDLESYRLNDVGANLLEMEKIKYESSLSDLWRDNPEKFVQYNVRDVEIMVKLDEKFRIWDMINEIQSQVGINPKDCIHSTRVTQAYFMRQTDKKMPKSEYSEKDKYTGATVLEETPGISNNVAVLDLASQYPSSMISYNMSPEKKVESPDATDAETITVGNGVTFEYDELGFIPRILFGLLDRRNEFKRRRDEHEPGTVEHMQNDLIQAALKVIANAVYGSMGSPKFVLYDREIAKSTTYVGRETIEWTVDKAHDYGYEVIYGDTDSIMISVGEDISNEVAVERAEDLAHRINESYDDYAEENGVNLRKFDGVDRDHMFELEAEKLYERFFQQQSQKKYAGKVVWEEGTYLDSWDFAQYGKKSDMAQLSRDVQVEFLKRLLRGADQKELQEYITDVCKKVKNNEYDIDYIGIPSKMKKPIEEYKTDRPVLRGSKYANQHTQETFGEGDKPKYCYVRRTPAGLPDTDVVCFSQLGLPDGFKVDEDKMVRKLVKDKTKRMLAVLGWDWNEMFRTSSSLLEY